MANAVLLKGGVIVVVLLAALAVFDAYSNYSYAGNQATGAAVLAKSEKCTETDNGLDFYTRGTISYNPDAKGNYKNTYEESCSDSTSLNEYYCDNGVARTTYFTCSKGCKDGACLSNCVLEEGKATCVAEEGQSSFVSMGGKTYEISTDFVVSTRTILTVNGEVTPSLMVGESVVLADGATLTILKLTVDNRAGGKRLVEFIIEVLAIPVRCSEGEKDIIWAGEGTRHYEGPDGRNYDIYAKQTDYPGKLLTLMVTALPRESTETAVMSEIEMLFNWQEEFTLRGIRQENLILKEYRKLEEKTNDGRKEYYGAEFCLQKVEEEKSFTGARWSCYDGSVGVAGSGEWVCLTYKDIMARADEFCQARSSGVSTFSVRGECESASATPTTNKLTLKADSFSVIALGAAFGSYYDASKSTCKPGDIFLASWVYAPTTEYDEETGEQYESTYQNIMLFDVDADSKLAVKPKGHGADIDKLKRSEKGLATFNWSEAAGAWILNEGPECTLALTYDSENMWENPQTVYAQPWVAKGINFVSVVPQMIGKTMRESQGLSPSSQPLRDVPDGCTDLTGELMGAYSNFGHSVPSASDALTKGDWDWWTPQHVFTQSELGLGMWLYSENTCKLDFR